MLAAMFVANVEIATAIIATLTSILLSNFAAKTTGSQMVVPKTIVVADVTTTPTKANMVIDGASPMIWPLIWAFCDLAYLVKSGIFKDNVAQNPTIPVKAGKKKAKKSLLFVNFEGVCRIGPKPFAAEIAQKSKASAAKGKNIALKTNNFRMLSTPR